MSTTTLYAPTVAAFVKAQDAFLKGTVKRDELFARSALAASAAIADGASLADLVAANTARFSKIADTAPKGTLYLSKVAIAWHAWTGDILALPVADGAPIVAVEVQSLVARVFKIKGLGAADITAVIGEAGQTQQGARDGLAALVKAAGVAAKAAKAAPTAGDDTDEDAASSGKREPSQTIGTLLARVAALVAAGTDVTDADRAAYKALAASLAPVKAVKLAA